MVRLYTLVTDEERIRLLAEGDATDRETHATHMHTWAGSILGPTHENLLYWVRQRPMSTDPTCKRKLWEQGHLRQKKIMLHVIARRSVSYLP
jgi:hypothetical protein